MQLWGQEDRMGYERLEKSLTDTIKEEQAKLGFRKEAIRLYYPLSSLNHSVSYTHLTLPTILRV